MKKVEELLIEHLNWTPQHVTNKKKALKHVFVKNDENFLNKVALYQDELKLSKAELAKMVKLFPNILSLTDETIKNKINFYCEEFHLTVSEFARIFKKLPTLMGLQESTVQQKANFYCQQFSLTKPEFNKMLKAMPSILSYSEARILDKIKFYTTNLNLTQEELNKMVKKTPTLVCLNEQTMQGKIAQINDLRISANNIVRNPRILTIPENTLKVRYLLLRQIASPEAIFSSNTLIINQDKSYARMAYFNDKKSQKANLLVINLSEKEFNRIYGVSSTELQQKYRLTPLKIKMLESALVPNEIKPFNENEIKYIKETYGTMENGF